MNVSCTLECIKSNTITTLDIRSGPGEDYRLLDSTNSDIVYHIVEVVNNWGKLSSRIGWIYLGNVNKL